MAFIPIDKMKALREAAKNGDERAKKIIRSQMLGEDFGSSLEEYFANPGQQGQANPQGTAPTSGHKIDDPKLAKFLEYNGVSEGDPDYESTVEAYYQEFPKARPSKGITEMKATEAGDDGINLPNDPDDGHSIYGDEDEPIEDGPNAPQQEKSCIDALIDDEYEAIQAYDKAISEVMRMDLSDAVKKGILSDLNDIRKDETEHVEKLNRLKGSLDKKEESTEGMNHVQ